MISIHCSVAASIPTLLCLASSRQGFGERHAAAFSAASPKESSTRRILIHRTHEPGRTSLRSSARRTHADRSTRLYAVGYSNGVNIAVGCLPALAARSRCSGAALLRPMVPLVPEPLPDLKNAPVLITRLDIRDPIVPSRQCLRWATSVTQPSGADVAWAVENAATVLTANMLSDTTKR